MIKKVKKQFVLFAALIISIIIGITLLVSYNRISGPHFHRYIITGVILIVAVIIGSMLISNLAIRPIQKTWQQQLDFTADASHELRTPLAVIQSNLEIVMESDDTATIAEQRKWLENIEWESHRMNELVDALLTLSRADTGSNPPIREELPLSCLANQKIDGFFALAKSKSIQIQVEISEELVLFADRSKIEQLLTIFIDNALKYMGRPGTILLKATPTNKGVKIEIRDDGIGIAPDDLSHVFERFYRADKSRSSHIMGSGLGLSIAQMIVSEHGGTIGVESTLGIGTSFTIFLPNKTTSKGALHAN